MGADDWRDVVAVHVCVRARGEPMPEAARHVDCDGRTTIAPEGRAHLVLHRIVAVRNSEVAFVDPVRDAATAHEALR